MAGQGSSGRRVWGCLAFAVIAIVVLCLAGSCTAFVIGGGVGDDDDEQARVREMGGGLVLVDAPKRSCWTLTAADERLEDGVWPPPSGEDRLTRSEEAEVEEAGGEFEQTGCGPASVTLPEAIIFGSVSLSLDGDGWDDRFSYATWAWLSNTLRPHGGAIAVDRPDTAVYTRLFYRHPGKVFNGVEQIAQGQFADAGGLDLDGDLRSRLRRGGVDPAAFSRDRARAASAFMSAQYPSAGAARKALRRVMRPAGAQLEVKALGQVGVDETSPALGVSEGKVAPDALAALKAIDTAGGESGKQAPKVRRWFASWQLASLRPDIESGYEYEGAARSVGALTSIDPSRKSRWQAMRTTWQDKAATLKAQEQAEIDAYSPPAGGGGGGWYPGCDGDGDGVCFE